MIIDSSNVLSNKGNNSIADWIIIELRNRNNPSLIQYSLPFLLQKDGDIVNLDGISPAEFKNIPRDYYYIAIKHKNHLSFRTKNPVALTSNTSYLNFTNNSIPLHGAYPTIYIGNNIYSMIAGDANSDGAVDAFDYVIWETQNGLFDDYQLNADFNLDGAVDAFDYVIWELNNGKYEELD